MLIFVNIGYVVLRKMEMWKVYDNNVDKIKVKFGLEKNYLSLGLGELKF